MPKLCAHCSQSSSSEEDRRTAANKEHLLGALLMLQDLNNTASHPAEVDTSARERILIIQQWSVTISRAGGAKSLPGTPCVGVNNGGFKVPLIMSAVQRAREKQTKHVWGEPLLLSPARPGRSRRHPPQSACQSFAWSPTGNQADRPPASQSIKWLTPLTSTAQKQTVRRCEGSAQTRLPTGQINTETMTKRGSDTARRAPRILPQTDGVSSKTSGTWRTNESGRGTGVGRGGGQRQDKYTNKRGKWERTDLPPEWGGGPHSKTTPWPSRTLTAFRLCVWKFSKSEKAKKRMNK